MKFSFKRGIQKTYMSLPKPIHKQKNRFKIPILILVFVIFLLVSGLVYFINSDYLKIKNIKVDLKGENCLDVKAVAEDRKIKGTNILFFNENLYKTEILKKYGCLDEAKVDKIMPDTINLTAYPRQPVILAIFLKNPLIQPDLSLNEATASTQAARLLKTADFEVNESSISGEFLMDKKGVLFYNPGQGEVINLPKLYILSNTEKPFSVKSIYVEGYLAIIEKLSWLGVEVFKVKLDSNKLIFNGVPKLIFGLEKDIPKQLASLQLILQKAKMNSKAVDIVDLRFDKPVVVYTNK